MSNQKDKSTQKPKMNISLHAVPDGKSMEDMKREIMAANPNAKFAGESDRQDNMEDKLKAMGMSMEDIEALVKGNEQKKPTLLKKMQDKFWG